MSQIEIINNIAKKLDSFHDKDVIKTLLDEVCKLEDVVSGSNRYLHEGEWLTVSELCKEYEKLTGLPITSQKLLYRLRKTDTVFDAFYFISEWDKFKCPDGIERTHYEIADHLKMSYQTWYARYLSNGLVKAWEMGDVAVYKPRKNAIAESKRSQVALDAIKIGTFEASYSA